MSRQFALPLFPEPGGWSLEPWASAKMEDE